MAVIGAGAGLVVSALTARVLEAFLYQVEPLDPLVYAGSAAILLAAAVVAVTQPALRAARTSPSRVLREE
jgi:predicted lysophospholipase L1 biosynthesis ABC-type transport system permease subunit